MRIALAQFTPLAGDVDGNLSQMQGLLGTGARQHADLVCFPELCLPGYLLEPAAYTGGFLADLARAAEALEQTARERQVRIIYGTAEACAGTLRNVVVITDRRAFVFEGIAAARAIENVAYVVCVNQTGTMGLTQFHGGSRIIDPLGNTLLEMGDTVGLFSADLNVDWVSRLRSSDHPATYPLRDDRRPPMPVRRGPFP